MCVWMQFIQALHKVPAIQQPRLVKSLKIPYLTLLYTRQYVHVSTYIYIYVNIKLYMIYIYII